MWYYNTRKTTNSPVPEKGCTGVALAGYILQQRQRRTRYEIDRELLEAGHDGGAIEAAWQTIADQQKDLNEIWQPSKPAKKPPPKR
jgi:hypothetical protein